MKLPQEEMGTCPVCEKDTEKLPKLICVQTPQGVQCRKPTMQDKIDWLRERAKAKGKI